MLLPCIWCHAAATESLAVVSVVCSDCLIDVTTTVCVVPRARLDRCLTHTMNSVHSCANLESQHTGSMCKGMPVLLMSASWVNTV